MEEKERLEAIEMWDSKLKISWTDGITNKKVIERTSKVKLLWKITS